VVSRHEQEHLGQRQAGEEPRRDPPLCTARVRVGQPVDRGFEVGRSAVGTVGWVAGEQPLGRWLVERGECGGCQSTSGRYWPPGARRAEPPDSARPVRDRHVQPGGLMVSESPATSSERSAGRDHAGELLVGERCSGLPGGRWRR
jgi:hypothetical protein